MWRCICVCVWVWAWICSFRMCTKRRHENAGYNTNIYIRALVEIGLKEEEEKQSLVIRSLWCSGGFFFYDEQKLIFLEFILSLVCLLHALANTKLQFQRIQSHHPL